MKTEKHFLDMSTEEQQEANERDLREMAHYYGGWDELIQVIKNLQQNDESNQESVPSDWWSGGIADNH